MLGFLAGPNVEPTFVEDDRELVVRLTELNRQVAQGERAYDPFAYPVD